MGPRIVEDPRAEPFDHVDVGGQRDGLAGTRRFNVARSVPRHPRQVREGDDIGDGSDIDERGPSCDRKSGQGKALDRREDRNGGPTEMDECPALSADHMCGLAKTRPASDSQDHAGRSRVRAAVPAPSGQFGAAFYAATRRQRLRGARARHLFAWECPSPGTTDRNPARTHLRGPKGPHPSVTKSEEHIHSLGI